MLSAFILYVSGRTSSLTSTQNDRFLRIFFLLKYIYSQSFCYKSAERKSPKKKFFFVFSFDTNPGFMSTKQAHYQLDYGDFLITEYNNLI